jgi:hypothetical protein
VQIAVRQAKCGIRLREILVVAREPREDLAFRRPLVEELVRVVVIAVAG